MKTLSTFANAGWDVAAGYDASKTWGICERVNNGYPFLTMEYTSDPCTEQEPVTNPSSDPDPDTNQESNTNTGTGTIPSSTPATSGTASNNLAPSSRVDRLHVRNELPSKTLAPGVNTLLNKVVTTTSGVKMNPTVRFLFGKSLRPAGDVEIPSRYWVTKSGKLRVFIGVPKPKAALLVLRSATPVHGTTLVVQKAYRVR